MVEIFADIPDGHPLFERFSFFAAAGAGLFRGPGGAARRAPARRRVGPRPGAADRPGPALQREPPPPRPARRDAARRGSSRRAPISPSCCPRACSRRSSSTTRRACAPRRACRTTCCSAASPTTRRAPRPRSSGLIRRVLTERGLDGDVSRIGLDTPVDPRGDDLTSSEIAAIDLVRCLVRRPDVLVVERALDGLPGPAADGLVARLRRALVGRGLVLVTSELSPAHGHAALRRGDPLRARRAGSWRTGASRSRGTWPSHDRGLARRSARSSAPMCAGAHAARDTAESRCACMVWRDAPCRDALQVRFWGVRGSICASGPQFVEFGGHTPCVEVRCGSRLFIVDAGTGIAPLGAELGAARPARRSTSCSATCISTTSAACRSSSRPSSARPGHPHLLRQPRRRERQGGARPALRAADLPGPPRSAAGPLRASSASRPARPCSFADGARVETHPAEPSRRRDRLPLPPSAAAASATSATSSTREPWPDPDSCGSSPAPTS